MEGGVEGFDRVLHRLLHYSICSGKRVADPCLIPVPFFCSGIFWTKNKRSILRVGFFGVKLARSIFRCRFCSVFLSRWWSPDGRAFLICLLTMIIVINIRFQVGTIQLDFMARQNDGQFFRVP